MIPRPLQWRSQSFAIEPGAAIAALQPAGGIKSCGFRINLVLEGEHSMCKPGR